MKNYTHPLHQLLSLTFLVAFFAGWPASASASEDAKTKSTAPGTMQSATKLGDLSPFRLIAEDVQTFVKKGDLPTAKARIKDLEISWDAAEAGLKHRAPKDWRLLDKAIDRALDALRATPPSQLECEKAVSAMLTVFNSLTDAAPISTPAQ